MWLPKLRAVEAGCAAISKARERLFSRRGSACIAGRCDPPSRTANGIAFAVVLGKSWQAIDEFDPSGTGGGRPLSPEQRQERQCAFPWRGASKAKCMQCHHRRGLSGIPGISDRRRSVAW
jgi:hypothetical protein